LLKNIPSGVENPKENDQRESEPVFWRNPPRGNRPICTREGRTRKMGGWVDGVRLPARLLFYPEGKALNAAKAALRHNFAGEIIKKYQFECAQNEHL